MASDDGHHWFSSLLVRKQENQWWLSSGAIGLCSVLRYLTLQKRRSWPCKACSSHSLIMLPLHSFDSLAYFVICSTVIPISLLLVLIYLTRSKKSNTERYEVSFTNDGKSRRPLGPFEVGFIGTEKNRYGIVITVLTIESQVPLNPLMVERVMTMLSKRYPLLHR